MEDTAEVLRQNNASTDPVQSQKSNTKLWGVAIAVGLLILGVGAFGGLGLLHTHGLMSLPQWLASAVGTVGATPYNMSLWAIAGGGGVLGGALTIGGTVKVVRSKPTIPSRPSSTAVEPVPDEEEGLEINIKGTVEAEKQGPEINIKGIVKTQERQVESSESITPFGPETLEAFNESQFLSTQGFVSKYINGGNDPIDGIQINGIGNGRVFVFSQEKGWPRDEVMIPINQQEGINMRFFSMEKRSYTHSVFGLLGDRAEVVVRKHSDGIYVTKTTSLDELEALLGILENKKYQPRYPHPRISEPL